MTKRANEILAEFVAIHSVSSVSNRAVIDRAIQYLDPRIWRFQEHIYRDVSGAEKVNLVAQTDGAEVAELALVCHTDTVSFEAEWSEAIHPQQRDGRLYGRGSCDVKGYLACVIAVASELNHPPAKPLILCLTADEEIGCVGARFLASRKAFFARRMLIGEPTGMTPIRAGKGYGLGEIIVNGEEAHSAFPQHGRSAIREAARVIERLDRVAAHLADQRNEDFDPPYTTLNIGRIEGGTAKNIIPGECRMMVEWRPVPGQDAMWAANLIEEAIRGLSARLGVQRADPPFCPSKVRQFVTLMEELTGRASGTVAFGTEAAHLSPLADEVVVCGPGDMTVAHKTGEFVPISELDRCVGMLETLIARVCR